MPSAKTDDAGDNAMAKRVLIVDDEPNLLVSLEFLFRRDGYDVRLAHDGEQGLAAVREWRPDVVLLDVTMPRRSGFEVCQAIRADEALAPTRVIMLSARAREADIAKGLALGADAYLTKPFSTSELLQRVHSLLGDGA